MTNEELLRRVAEIEGCDRERGFWYHPEIDPGEPFDPLEDKGQSMELVEKYRMDVSCDEEERWYAFVPRRYGTYPGATDSSLNRAILLAIVAAHGGEDGG